MNILKFLRNYTIFSLAFRKFAVEINSKVYFATFLSTEDMMVRIQYIQPITSHVDRNVAIFLSWALKDGRAN